MRKKKNSLFNLIVMLIVAIVALGALGGVIGMFKGENGGSGGESAVFVLSYDGKIVTNNTNLGTLPSGAKFSVTGSGDYSVTVTATNTPENNFTFTVGQDTKQWSEQADKNFTKAFTITKDNTNPVAQSFTLEYGKLDQILSNVLDGVCLCSAGDVTATFNVTVKGTNAVSFQFNVKEHITVSDYVPVTGIVLDPATIIF